MSKISGNMTICEIIEAYPETSEVFISNGFDKFFKNDSIKKTGKYLKLESAIKTKGYDISTYIKMLEEKIDEENNIVDITLRQETSKVSDIKISGLLPCPVRIPLLESIDSFLSKFERKMSLKVDYKLEAASIGADWLEKNITKVSKIEEFPDIFISAGFDVFFDQESICKFKEKNVFIDITEEDINVDFKSSNIKDPKQHYSIISVVPAVFMVNLEELGEQPIPKKWEDILKPEFAQKVALPVGDFDLFNGILLNIYKEFGEEGVKRLSRSLLKSMHPAQMVKKSLSRDKSKPTVTIIPYFFTKMMKNASKINVIWPEDGAIVCPIFMLIKRDKQNILKDIAEFIGGCDVGEILSHGGLFPSLNKDVENNLPSNATFKWLGWDYIYSNDIGKIIKITNDIFKKNSNGISI